MTGLGARRVQGFNTGRLGVSAAVSGIEPRALHRDLSLIGILVPPPPIVSPLRTAGIKGNIPMLSAVRGLGCRALLKLKGARGFVG